MVVSLNYVCFNNPSSLSTEGMLSVAAESSASWVLTICAFEYDPCRPCLQNMFVAENLENTEMQERREQLTWTLTTE